MKTLLLGILFNITAHAEIVTDAPFVDDVTPKERIAIQMTSCSSIAGSATAHWRGFDFVGESHVSGVPNASCAFWEI